MGKYILTENQTDIQQKNIIISVFMDLYDVWLVILNCIKKYFMAVWLKMDLMYCTYFTIIIISKQIINSKSWMAIWLKTKGLSPSFFFNFCTVLYNFFPQSFQGSPGPPGVNGPPGPTGKRVSVCSEEILSFKKKLINDFCEDFFS